jgi:ABC-type dipeptide/oligopeptide/nickel transport system permease component
LAVARNVFRNAIVPLLSLLVTRTTSVLLLGLYVVESVFEVPGLGLLTLEAIRYPDVGVITAVVFLAVLAGGLGNLLQDLASELLDPRVDRE